MNKFSHFAPFFILVFMVSIIGLSTYKINVKQQVRVEETTNNDKTQTSFFTKTDITLPDFSLPNLYDPSNPFTKQDLIGKYTVINFFASWCTTCRAEHKALLGLKTQGIVDIYGVAWRDINANTKTYLKEGGNPYVKTASDNKALFSKITGIKAVPETVIVNPEGRIVRRYQGNLEYFTINEIREFVTK